MLATAPGRFPHRPAPPPAPASASALAPAPDRLRPRSPRAPQPWAMPPTQLRSRPPATNLLPPLAHPALPPGHTQKSPATVAEESRPEPWRCPAVPAKERVQPPAPLAPGEEQRLSALHRQAGSRDPPAHGQPGSPRSCRPNRALLLLNEQGLGVSFSPLTSPGTVGTERSN